jgi:hypothetical protein
MRWKTCRLFQPVEAKIDRLKIRHCRADAPRRERWGVWIGDTVMLFRAREMRYFASRYDCESRLNATF